MIKFIIMLPRAPKRWWLAAVSCTALLLGQGNSFARREKPVDQLLLLWNGFRIQAEKPALLVRPGSSQVASFMGKDRAFNLQVVSCEGLPCQVGGGGLSFRAPTQSGNYWLTVHVQIHRPDHSPAIAISQIAVLVGFPSSLLQHGFLNGFELGEYPDWTKMKNPEYYKPPEFFYYLDSQVMGAWLSEHIRLGDLGYDGRAPLPQYFALDLALVKKLEVMKQELELRGYPSRLHFIGGGFISPKSNQERTSKNAAAAGLSRHLWGEAVDFIIDEAPRDQLMDDMNKDGVIDVRDCFVIRDLVTRLEKAGRVRPGGFGIYSPPKHDMLQMHIDVRGFATRWGYQEYNPQELSNVPPKKSQKPGG